MGRQTKLTKERTKRLIDALKLGAPTCTAYAVAGIGETTFYTWMERGRPDGTDPKDEPYRVFRANVTRAKQEAELAHLANIQAAAPDDWRASAWYLQHRMPEQYSEHRHRYSDDGRRKQAAEARQAEAKADALEALAKGNGGIVAMGLAQLIDSPDVTDAERATVEAMLERLGARVIRRRDLGAEPAGEGEG